MRDAVAGVGRSLSGIIADGWEEGALDTTCLGIADKIRRRSSEWCTCSSEFSPFTDRCWGKTTYRFGFT
jgi:hypothetical protein